MSNTPINRLDYATPDLNRPKTRWWALFTLLAALVLIIMLLPEPRSRDVSPRVKCASNLRQIGQAIFLYTNDNAGQYPDSLGTLLLNEDIPSPIFVCPSSHGIASAKPTTREQAAEIDSGKCCSYIDLGRGCVAGRVLADQVIVYEPLTNHGGDGMNVLFGDGHVEFLGKVQAASILNQIAAGKTIVRLPDSPTTTTRP